MANRVEVYFTGLICLISRNQGKNTKSHAAAIIADDHTVQLLIGDPKDPNKVGQTYDLNAGDHVYLGDEGREGIAGRSTILDRHLPPLDYLVDGDLLYKVQTAGHRDKAAYLHLLNGELIPAWAYECGASYSLDGNEHSYSCVARLTYLETRVSSVTVLIKRANAPDDSYTTDNWILLRNIYSGRQAHNTLDHVKFNRNITTGKRYATVKKGDDCGNQEISFGKFTKNVIANIGRDMDVDCVGSQWP